MSALKLYLILHIIFSSIIICINSEAKTGRPQITLKDGIIEGKKTKSVDKGKTYYSFQGIPYAKPPLGDLRFAPPQSPGNWSNVLDATKPANTCIEIDYASGGEEDCLYLNVYTPALNKSLPVIVWIHGGSFIFVFNNYTLTGTDFFMEEDVIVVTIHYRLGVFGFLSTEDDVIPGNFGLKDQVMAISWVYDNIAAFGGDPARITLMGQSAGAASTGYMGLVPELEGKIAGIIQQSGSPLCPFALGRYHRIGAYILSTRMGLQTQNSYEILKKLREADAVDLRDKSLITHYDISLAISTFSGFLYAPGMESRKYYNPLITEMSHEQLKKGSFDKIPRMIGINSLEAMFFVDDFESKNQSYQNFDELVRRYIPQSMNTRSEHVGQLIRNHYTNNTPFTSNLFNMVHFCSDTQFVRPVIKDASSVSKYVTTYFYEFSYQGKLGYPLERPLNGVAHGEELAYLFYDKNAGQVSEADKSVRQKLVRLWSNFAKYGNPTPIKDKLLDNEKWLPIEPADKSVNYMNIGEKLRSSVNSHHEDVQFWNNLYDKYGNPPFDTY